MAVSSGWGQVRMLRGNAFPVSFYLTLGLAGLCLGFAELFFLAWMPIFVVALWVAFYGAWKVEGRWHLSESAANTLGLVIAFGMMGWIVFRMPRNDEELQAAGVPWPAGLLPHLGPLLMVLTAVKAFRPKKVADFWVLQALGLMMVTLASVLAGEIHHGLWLVIYLLSLHWCLANYQSQRGRWAALSEHDRSQVPLFASAEGSTKPGRAVGLGAVGVWTTLALLLGFVLFFFTPRPSSVQWVPHKLTVAGKGVLTAGFDTGMDLNRVGKIELSEEVAFEVVTQDHEGRTVDLPDSIYWRGETLDHYHNGRWGSGSQTSDLWPDHREKRDMGGVSLRPQIVSVPNVLGSPHPSERPTDLKAGHTYLTFRIKPAMGGLLVAAEPVDIDLGVGIHPYSGEKQLRSGIFAHLQGTDTLMAVAQRRRSTVHFGQVLDPQADPWVRPAERLHSGYREHFLLQAPPLDLARWARKLILKPSGLTEAERTLDDKGRVAPEHHQRVAQALTNYFANSGEYLYTLNLRRMDANIDPIFDFLTNIKEGHCERYASGLVLVLRSLGIPSRLVHGYRGTEKGDDHRFYVRFSQAHSWAQALVPNASGEGEQWCLLDPTPSAEAPLDRWQSFWGWVSDGIRVGRGKFRDLVLEYGSDQQSETLRSLWTGMRSLEEEGFGHPLVWLGTGVGLVVAGRYGRKPLAQWWQTRQSATALGSQRAWMKDFFALVRTHLNLTPTASQTLREFVARVQADWPTRCPGELIPDLTPLADFSNQLRFSTQPLTAEQDAAMAEIVAQMRASVVPA